MLQILLFCYKMELVGNISRVKIRNTSLHKLTVYAAMCIDGYDEPKPAWLQRTRNELKSWLLRTGPNPPFSNSQNIVPQKEPRTKT